jgi:D-aminopeptidase
MPEPTARARARDLGIVVGGLQPGPLNAITDVPGVRVGHTTVRAGDARTGVTAIWPHDGDLFRERLYAGIDVLNGYGEMTSRTVIEEWGMLGAPILLADSVSVGRVWDATVRYLAARDPAIGDVDVDFPVVAECDDGTLNDNRSFPVEDRHVVAALDGATTGRVEEGCVGAGTGTQQFDFKGGIGTASRRVDVGGRSYTVGVLLNTNYGARHQLVVNGVPVGRLITGGMPVVHREGSCIGVLATDAPLHPLQCRRMARRIGFGLVRTGSVGSDGSGEIFLAFSTAQRIPRDAPGEGHAIRVIVEGGFWTQGSPIDALFEAAVEASEEAALNALFTATTTRGRDGNVLEAIPIERTLEILEARGAVSR